MAKLIINADDFGYSEQFNRMILELIEEGHVTSTSAMVDYINEEQTEQVEKLASLSEQNIVSVGLHVVFKNTNFRDETERQFRKFIDIFWFEPSHIDIHKMTCLEDGYPVIQRFCKQMKIPCKNLSAFGKGIMIDEELITTKESVFDGTEKSFDEIKRWLGSLKDDFYTISFHPGYYDPKSTSSLNRERETDAKNIRKIISILSSYNIRLVNFHDLAASFS